MSTLKKYDFEIRSLKNYQDKNSPHSLSKFEFLAQNRKQAEKYRESLIEHFENNMPFQVKMPWEKTDLNENEY